LFVVRGAIERLRAGIGDLLYSARCPDRLLEQPAYIKYIKYINR
jgi:hypothetical protein